MSELRECPFCGGEAYHTGPLLGVRYFHCQDCGAETSFRVTGLHIDDQWARYNNRAIDEQAIREDERRKGANIIKSKVFHDGYRERLRVPSYEIIDAIMEGCDK